MNIQELPNKIDMINVSFANRIKCKYSSKERKKIFLRYVKEYLIYSTIKKDLLCLFSNDKICSFKMKDWLKLVINFHINDNSFCHHFYNIVNEDWISFLKENKLYDR